jgi:hypothetical protein
MVLVAERHGLFEGHSPIDDKAHVEAVRGHSEQWDRQNGPDDAQPGDSVHARIEYLWHI